MWEEHGAWIIQQMLLQSFCTSASSAADRELKVNVATMAFLDLSTADQLVRNDLALLVAAAWNAEINNATMELREVFSQISFQNAFY
jgi:hypothetical protein